MEPSLPLDPVSYHALILTCISQREARPGAPGNPSGSPSDALRSREKTAAPPGRPRGRGVVCRPANSPEAAGQGAPRKLPCARAQPEPPGEGRRLTTRSVHRPLSALTSPTGPRRPELALGGLSAPAGARPPEALRSARTHLSHRPESRAWEGPLGLQAGPPTPCSPRSPSQARGAGADPRTGRACGPAAPFFLCPFGDLAEPGPGQQGLWLTAAALAGKAVLSALPTHTPRLCS